MQNTLFENAGLPIPENKRNSIEKLIGFTLPGVYWEYALLDEPRYLTKKRFPTEFPTSWEEDYFEVEALIEPFGDSGLCGGFNSAYLIAEWEYPNIGLVLFTTPSGGHDTVMLDYSVCGPAGEPRVVYVDEDRIPKVIANTLQEFFATLY